MDIETIFNNMMQSNPQFKKFVEENRGLNEQQLMKKFNVNPAVIKQLFNAGQR